MAINIPNSLIQQFHFVILLGNETILNELCQKTLDSGVFNHEISEYFKILMALRQNKLTAAQERCNNLFNINPEFSLGLVLAHEIAQELNNQNDCKFIKKYLLAYPLQREYEELLPNFPLFRIKKFAENEPQNDLDRLTQKIINDPNIVDNWINLWQYMQDARLGLQILNLLPSVPAFILSDPRMLAIAINLNISLGNLDKALDYIEEYEEYVAPIVGHIMENFQNELIGQDHSYLLSLLPDIPIKPIKSVFTIKAQKHFVAVFIHSELWKNYSQFTQLQTILNFYGDDAIIYETSNRDLVAMMAKNSRNLSKCSPHTIAQIIHNDGCKQIFMMNPWYHHELAHIIKGVNPEISLHHSQYYDINIGLKIHGLPSEITPNIPKWQAINNPKPEYFLGVLVKPHQLNHNTPRILGEITKILNKKILIVGCELAEKYSLLTQAINEYCGKELAFCQYNFEHFFAAGQFLCQNSRAIIMDANYSYTDFLAYALAANMPISFHQEAKKSYDFTYYLLKHHQPQAIHKDYIEQMEFLMSIYSDYSQNT